MFPTWALALKIAAQREAERAQHSSGLSATLNAAEAASSVECEELWRARRTQADPKGAHP